MASRSDITAGRAHIELYVKNSRLIKGLGLAKAELQSLGKNIMQIGGWLTGLGAGLVGPMAGAIKHFADAGDWLDKMSGRTSVAATELAELQFAAEQSGASLNDVEVALRHMQKQGHSASNFDELAAEIAAIEDPTQRAQRAIEVFGKKAGIQLLPMLGSLKELRAEARERGLVPSEEAVKDAAKITDAFNRIRRTGMAVAFEVGAALTPMLLPALETIAQITTRTIHWIKENASLVRTIAAVAGGVLAVGAGVTAVGALIFGLGAAFGLVAGAVTTVAGLVGSLLSPTVLIVAALAGGVYAWARFTASGQTTLRTLTAGFQALLSIGRDVVDGIGDALLAGDLQLAGQIAVKGLQLVFARGVDALTAMIGGVLGALIGTIGSQLIQGDLAGAWQTAVQGMGAVWDAFVAGVVNAFADAIRQVLAMWQRATATVSTGLGVIQTALNIKGHTGAANAIGAARNGLGVGGSAITAGLGTLSSAASAAGAIRQTQANKAAEDFGKTLVGTSGMADRLAAELAELREQAAAAREAARSGTSVTGPASAEDLKGAVSSTFSAAGALALGWGGGPAQEMLRETRDMRKGIFQVLDAVKASQKEIPNGIAAALVLKT